MKRAEAEQQIQSLEKVLNVSSFPDEALPVIKAVQEKVWGDLARAED